MAPDTSSDGVKCLKDSCRDIVTDVLLAHGVRDHHAEIADQVLTIFNRRTVALTGLNIGCVNIELIKENPLGCFLQYASDPSASLHFNIARGVAHLGVSAV